MGSGPPPRRGYRSLCPSRSCPCPLRGGARGATGSRDLGAGTGREREGDGRDGGREREREREIRPGLADPGARRQMVLRQLDGLGQRRRAVALDPLGRSPG